MGHGGHGWDGLGRAIRSGELEIRNCRNAREGESSQVLDRWGLGRHWVSIRRKPPTQPAWRPAWCCVGIGDVKVRKVKCINCTIKLTVL